MAFKKGNKLSATRPNRKNAGRKPKPITLAKREFLQQRASEAQFAFDLHVKTMRDEQRDLNLRLGAAQVVMAEVWGKPTQRQEISGADSTPLRFVVVPIGHQAQGAPDADSVPDQSG